MNIKRLFFDQWYKIRPPESVQYWKNGAPARAKVGHAKEGHLEMEIKGEKYKYPGFPRGPVLLGPLAKMKKKVKNAIFNKVFGELEDMANDMKYDMLPDEKCVPAVREMARVFDKMIEMEIVDDMKGRLRMIKRVLIFFLNEDDAYRFRAQYFFSEINRKKVKLSKADKYYARGKYWKVDYDKYSY